MKKIFSLSLLSFLALSCLFGCGGGATSLSGKTFTIESIKQNEIDVSTDYLNRVNCTFYDSTFIFELDYGKDSYSYFIGNYSIENENVSIIINKVVGTMENTSDPVLLGFKTQNFQYEDSKLIINASINGDTYTYVLK